MFLLRKHHEFAPALTLLVVCTISSACTAWRTTSLEPHRFSVDTSPERARLTLSNGTRLTASHPVIVGDSLVWWGLGESPANSTRSADLVSNIRQVEVRGANAGGTIGLLILVGGVVGVLAILSALAGNAGS